MQNGKLTKKSRIGNRTIEVLSILAILLLFGFPAYHFDHLPDQIPSHFNFWGEADSFSGKKVIWTLPIVGVFLYIVLTLVSKIPFSKEEMDPTPIQEQQDRHAISMHMVQMLKLVVLWIFVIIVAQTVYIAHEVQPSLPYGMTAGFVVVIFAIVIYYTSKMRKAE